MLFVSSEMTKGFQMSMASFQSRNRDAFCFKLLTFNFILYVYISFNLVIEMLFVSRTIGESYDIFTTTFQSRNRDAFCFKPLNTLSSAIHFDEFQSRNRDTFCFKSIMTETEVEGTSVEFQSRNRDAFCFKCCTKKHYQVSSECVSISESRRFLFQVKSWRTRHTLQARVSISESRRFLFQARKNPSGRYPVNVSISESRRFLFQASTETPHPLTITEFQSRNRDAFCFKLGIGVPSYKCFAFQSRNRDAFCFK